MRATDYHVLVNKKYRTHNFSGWVSHYGGSGEDGQAIVFDDSFEHEVVHTGEADRYVLLLVLKHPDIEYIV